MRDLLQTLENWLEKKWGSIPTESEDIKPTPEPTINTESPSTIEERLQQYKADQVAQLRISDTALHEAKKLDVFRELAEAAQKEFGEGASHVNVTEYLNMITQGISRYIPAPASQAAITLHEMQHQHVREHLYHAVTVKRAQDTPYVSEADSWRTDPVLKEIRNGKRNEFLARHNANTAAKYAGMTPDEIKLVLVERDRLNNLSIHGKYDAMRNQPPPTVSNNAVLASEMHSWVQSFDDEIVEEQTESSISKGDVNTDS